MMKTPSCVDLSKRFPAYRTAWSEDYLPGQDFDPWLLEIRGRLGTIYPYGGELLCAYTDKKYTRARLKALPGAEVWQEGDSELIVRFPTELAEPFFRLLKSRKRRVLSPEAQAAAVTRGQTLRLNFGKGKKGPVAPQEARTPPDCTRVPEWAAKPGTIAYAPMVTP